MRKISPVLTVLGLLALTHPVAAVFVCLAVAGTLVVLSVEHRPPVGRLLGLPAVMGVAFAMTLLALFVFVFDDRVSVWLDGMARAGAITFARTDTTGVARYYLANRFLPGFAVVLVPALLALWALRTPPAASRAVWPRRVVLVVIYLVSVGAAAWLCWVFRPRSGRMDLLAWLAFASAVTGLVSILYTGIPVLTATICT